jgi:hypothetical protein
MADKGFFASLFDLSFTSLITTKIIKIVYAISLVFIALVAVVSIVAAFRESPGLGIATLIIIAPLLTLLYAIYTRVILEFIITVFRIAEYNRDAVIELRALRGGAGPSGLPTSEGARR